eukprot:236942-Hanusia_phi.AAC.4
MEKVFCASCMLEEAKELGRGRKVRRGEGEGAKGGEGGGGGNGGMEGRKKREMTTRRYWKHQDFKISLADAELALRSLAPVLPGMLHLLLQSSFTLPTPPLPCPVLPSPSSYACASGVRGDHRGGGESPLAACLPREEREERDRSARQQQQQ